VRWPLPSNVAHAPRAVLLSEARHALRFACVGALGVGVNSVLLWLLTDHVGLYYLISSVLATEAAVLFNFTLNHFWTFAGPREAESILAKLVKYNAIAVVGLLLTVVSLWFLTELLHLHYLAANLVAISAGTLWNFAAIRRWTWAGAGLGKPVLTPDPPAVERFLAFRAAVVGSTRAVFEAAPVLIVLLAMIWIAASHPGAWAPGGALLLGTVFVFCLGVPRRDALLYLQAAVVAVSAVNYLAWRFSVTNWAGWWLAVPLFVAELFGGLHTLGLQYTVWPRREPDVRMEEDPTRRPIFIFIPTVDEGPEVLALTLRGAFAARDRYQSLFPRGRVTIVVCNDGYVAGIPNWRETETLAQHLGVVCVTRRAGGGAKAGNLENARRLVGAIGDALVVIFDADQIAEPNFLVRTVPLLADRSVGWVQTGQYYRNLDNPVARWAHDQQALFYRVLCQGKSAQNSAFICGTNVVLRAVALDELGGLPQDSVTEDFAASIELHPWWRGIFISEVLAWGLGPVDLPSYFAQQRRWATGTLGVLRRHWRVIFLPSRGDLTGQQRLQYALACTHYLSGLRDAIYIFAPVVFLVTGIPAVRGADLGGFASHFLPYWLASQIAFWHVAGRHTSIRGVVIGFGSFPVLLGSLLTVVLGRRIGFAVTAKRRTAEARWIWGAWGHLVPHLAAALACLMALGFALAGTGVGAPVVVSALWVVYTLMMLSGVLWLGVVDQLSVPAGWLAWRDAWRQVIVPVRRTIQVASATIWMRPLLGALAGMLMVVALGVTVSGASVPASVSTFEPQTEVGQRHLGVTLPVELLKEQPPLLERRLGRSFGIVGRTQTISDSFDAIWAHDLATRGTRPWITLVFATTGPPSLEASLPAIANGIHDEALRRWARSIRAYGRPVYLTVLPHVDRNWAVTSAVANGGIPQDVSRAWRHVQEVFAREGATNVAWVWAPADPAGDALFAPTLGSRDVVALSLISFPDDTWVDPTAALASVAARYPHTPLLLEVSAAGAPERKASWLRDVGAAVSASSTVYALVYHEGAPSPQASLAEHQAWSMNSDPLALSAMVEVTQVTTSAPTTSSPDSPGRTMPDMAGRRSNRS
jgi:cellulose synthase/poly-beta-1,6-N-acetylglucosamine synthase-like glycosyltransferase/putative flippase GtrA